MPWILMGVLTTVQVLGNVFSSYKEMILNHQEEIRYFTDSVLFFIKNPNPAINNVLISYITGAILPIVALCMTAMVVSLLDKEKAKQVPLETQPVTEMKGAAEPKNNHEEVIF